MKREIILRLLPEETTNRDIILRKISEKTQDDGFEPKFYWVIKKSTDARKNPVKIVLKLLVSDSYEDLKSNIKPKEIPKLSSNAKQIVIVGAGPAGLFAALKAIELGLKPLIVERGKDVDSRRRDLALISRKNIIDPNSNFCFGEGGAGTFSDGKLYTRSKKRGNNKEVLELLYQFGANEEILIESHPHIGTDKLPGIIKNIRKKIIECGGEIKFNCKMTSVDIQGGIAKGIITDKGEKIEGPVFLAIGHSARDTYRQLKDDGVRIEAKGLAIGVRLEHSQHLIDCIQYHSKDGRGKWLPPAEYSFVEQVDSRGVYSFCMCPGGVIVPAVSDNNQIVVNGMSSSARGSKWANSGFVVELHPGDIPGYEHEGEFEMMALQESLEKRFFDESNCSLNAPAQGIKDFIDDKISNKLPSSSYTPGIHPANFNQLFPKEICSRLKQGLINIGKKKRAFITNDGILLGLESRTSSPIRIPRDSFTLNHEDIKNLYPMGEGAGYAGGIISSAIDGMRCVEAFYNNEIKVNGYNS